MNRKKKRREQINGQDEGKKNNMARWKDSDTWERKKKAARESRKQRGKEGLSVTDPSGIPVRERLKQKDCQFKANRGYTEQRLSQK